MNNEAYWIALAHLPRWGYGKINNLIVKFHHENKITIDEFFNLSSDEWGKSYSLDEKQIADLLTAKADLAKNAFLAESMLNDGIEIIPIISPRFSATLKTNLKGAHCPSLIYIKGDHSILDEDSIAIVGSRNATETSLKFTDNIARVAGTKFKVVVSGFAKGVDKQALDSSIVHLGKSIIVLPQGIMTFDAGFKKYYQNIVNGDVLVLSTFFPKSPWKAELAMARNPIIYGLAKEIYVAESSDKGGTWSGVIDGLRKGRKIYVRYPGADEVNANSLLIQKGAIPVDFEGNDISESVVIESPASEKITAIDSDTQTQLDFEESVYKALNENPLSVHDICTKLNLDARKISKALSSLERVESFKKGRTVYYRLADNRKSEQLNMFSSDSSSSTE